MEEKKEKMEEIQSRRDFFKSAAKKALPILGAVALMSVPVIGNAKEGNTLSGCYCQNTCSGGCTNNCTSCQNTCTGGCKNNCTGCQYTCTGGARKW